MLKVRLSVIVVCSIALISSCRTTHNATKSNYKVYKPIVKTKQTVKLTDERKELMEAAIIQDIELYTESCKKRREKKLKLNERLLLEVDNKNPSSIMLGDLNKQFNGNDYFLPVQSGFSVFRNGLLVGYTNRKKNKKAALISVDFIDQPSSRRAVVEISHSRASLAGVYKTYQLRKGKSKWVITKCKVNAYN